MKENHSSSKRNKFVAFFTKTIQRQILIPFLTLIILGGVAIASVSYGYSVSLTTDELLDNVESQMGSLDGSFDIFFQSQEQVIRNLASNQMLQDPEDNQSSLKQSLKNMNNATDSTKQIYYGVENNGDMITSTVLDLPADYDPRERPWYKKAVDNKGEVIWTEPYVDDDSGRLIISAAEAIYDNGELKGVVSGDVSLDSLLSIINDVEIGETGYAALMDQNGVFLSHPNQSYIGKDVSSESYFKGIMEQESPNGIVHYLFEEKEKAMAYAINKRTDLIVIGTVYKSELAQNARPILFPILITLAIVLILSIITSTFITRKLTKPIKQLQSNLKEVEEGNLQVPLNQHGENEIGQLSYSVHEMKESLRGLIRNVSNASTAVSTQSEELNQSANEVREGSEQIASTMQELSSGAESQATSSSQLSEMMEDFTSKIKESHHNGEQVAESSQEVLSMTNEGSRMMKQSVNQMETIDSIVKEAVDKVHGLDNQSQEITKLVEVIKDIAEQTNLLSLNAAIEAARAGEHGKGFAVVADEVRKLAEQVSVSLGEITTVVHNIQKESNLVAQSLESGYHEVEEGSKQIKVTGETFEKMNTSVSQMVDRIQVISTNLTDISENSTKMNQSIEEIASVSEESAAGVEQAAASAQQSSSSMEEISYNVNDLAKLAEQLSDEVGRYRV